MAHSTTLPMSDNLVLAANLAFVVGPLLAGLLGVAASAIWRAVTRMPEGFTFGLSIALGASSVALLAVTAAMVGWVLDVRGGVAVQGRIVGFDRSTETIRRPGDSSRARGRPVAIIRPVVEFTARDGRVHLIEGLGGSLAGLRLGDPVPLRYDPAKPEAAVVEDFQNRYGAPMFFFNLGVIGAMGSLWALLLALRGRRLHLAAQAAVPADAASRGARRERTMPMAWQGVGAAPPAGATTMPSAPAAPASGRFIRWRDAYGRPWSRRLLRLGIAQLAAAILLPLVIGFVTEVELLWIFAAALGSVSLAMLWFALAAALEPGRRELGLLLYGRSVGIVGFALYAIWLGGLGWGR